MTAITLQGITKRFGSTTAVDGVDLTIASGELFFLLGPSGCGKTTLLRMIAGFIEPTAGKILFGEREVTHTPPNKRNAGMVFQSYALWPHMSVYENVAYGLTVRKVAPAEKRERVMAALQSVRMAEYAQRKPNQLSGGQQQRVALARALVIQPTVLLLDEPLSNLDAKLRLEMRSEIKRICNETKITTVYVTHDQKEALSMADRVAVMREGKAQQIGPPRALYERPASRFVADFLGETNFIHAVVTAADGGQVELETAAGHIISLAPPTPRPTPHPPTQPTSMASTASTSSAEPADPAADLPKGGNVTCSIRPEALRLINGSPQRNTLSGKRLQTIYLGEVAQHLVELEDGTVLKVLEMHPSHFGERGDQLQLAVDPADVVLLAD